MRICLLSQFPGTFSNLRLSEEAQKIGELVRIDPLSVRIAWPGAVEAFDLTLNRVASVEADTFLWTLMELPSWGRQSNPWEIRKRLWDKTRQALWLSSQGLPFVPFFAHRRALLETDLRWQQFARDHATAHGWVLKVNRGMRGIGVHFFAHTTELFQWLETLYRLGDQDFLIQPRLAPGPEYRVTFIGSRPWAILERAAMGGAANFAQGGTARELKAIPEDVRRLIEQLSAKPMAELVSLDILMGNSGPVISDVNLVPGFEQLEAVTGRNLARDYLAHLLDS